MRSWNREPARRPAIKMMINASSAKTKASGNQRCDQSARATPKDSSLPNRSPGTLWDSTLVGMANPFFRGLQESSGALGRSRRAAFIPHLGIRSDRQIAARRISAMFARKTRMLAIAMLACCAAEWAMAQQAAPLTAVPPKAGDFIAQNFTLADGQSLPEIRMHYTTIGTPQRDVNGHVTNAVLVLHGTNRKGGVFLVPSFAGVLFGHEQLLDASKYYLILPDQLGAGLGKSTKPSDGLRANFPHYDYADMIAAVQMMLRQGLQIHHLRLAAGTSIGCIQGFTLTKPHPCD